MVPSAMYSVLVQPCLIRQVLCEVSRRMVFVDLALRNACFDGFRIDDRPEGAEISTLKRPNILAVLSGFVMLAS